MWDELFRGIAMNKILNYLKDLQTKINLQMYLIIVISTIIILTIFGSGIISIRSFSDIMLTKTKNYSMTIETQVKNGLNITLKNLNVRVDRVVNNSYIQDVLLKNPNLTKEAKERYLSILEEHFDPYSLDNYNIDSIDLYLKENGVIHYGSVNYYIKDIFNSEYYKKGILHPTLLYWMGYNKETGTIDAIRLIYDNKTFEVRGILVVRINKKYLIDTFTNYNMLEIDDMYIVNEDSQILSAKDINKIGEYFKEDYSNSMNKMSGLFEHGDNYILYQYLQSEIIPSMQLDSWKVIIIINKNKIYKDIYKVQNNIIKFMIFFILLGIAISVVISLKVTVPVKRLVGGMKKVTEGDFDVSIDYKGLKEILFLTESFNYMVSQTKELIKNVYEERMLRNEMELKALQRQMEPHFMYNTLQTISWKALENGVDEVYEMIQSLSYLLDANMERKDEKLIPVYKEILYIQAYIHLIEKQYEDKISFTLDIDEAINNYTIPKLLLQPFIENAIKHGIVNKLGPGRIEIKAFFKDENIVFKIIDDGIGLLPEKLRSIQDLIQNSDLESTNESIALRNTYKRLKLIYGDKFSFNIKSEFHKGTEVEISIGI